MKTADVSTIRMVAGGERKIKRVIHDGFLKEWIGFAWIVLRRATKSDSKRHPTVDGF